MRGRAPISNEIGTRGFALDMRARGEKNMYGIDEKARTWAQIDLGAMKHNLDIAKRTGVKVMCVIKANAYGHGAVVCCRCL